MAAQSQPAAVPRVLRVFLAGSDVAAGLGDGTAPTGAREGGLVAEIACGTCSHASLQATRERVEAARAVALLARRHPGWFQDDADGGRESLRFVRCGACGSVGDLAAVSLQRLKSDSTDASLPRVAAALAPWPGAGPQDEASASTPPGAPTHGRTSAAAADAAGAYSVSPALLVPEAAATVDETLLDGWCIPPGEVGSDVDDDASSDALWLGRVG